MASEPTAIRRIMVALDASSASANAMVNAVELANLLGAELIGLYVEDVNLLRLAGLPFAQEISAFSQTLRPLDAPELERHFRDEAARTRRMLLSRCGERGVPCRFEVFRGLIAAELLAAAAKADLMVMGKTGHSYAGTKRIGSITRLVVASGRGMLLVMQSGVLLHSPVIALYDGAPQSQKALAIAAHLARAPQNRLTVFVVAEDSEEARRLQRQVLDYLLMYELAADFRAMARYDLAGIARRIRQEGAGPVVIPCDVQADDGDQLCALIGEIDNPVLLVR